MDMLGLLHELVEIESPTGDTEAMRARVILEVAAPGFAVRLADEGIGSPDGRRLLAAAAEGAAAALVVEPPDADGHLKTARKGIGRFRYTIAGKPAHSSTPHKGASAIDELARLVLRLNALADP